VFTFERNGAERSKDHNKPVAVTPSCSVASSDERSQKNWLRNRIRLRRLRIRIRNRLASKFLTPNPDPAVCPSLPCFYILNPDPAPNPAFPKNPNLDPNPDPKSVADFGSVPISSSNAARSVDMLYWA